MKWTQQLVALGFYLALFFIHKKDYTEFVPTRSSKDHDFVTNARRVVEQAIGEKLDGSPLDDPNAGKNPHAVALGKLGGPKGGRARADSLSPRKRRMIAKRAAAARWNKKTTKNS